MKNNKKITYSPALAFLLATGTVFSAVAQEAPETESIYTVVDTQPAYPGGHDAMLKFLVENLKYPQEAIEERKEGKVYVSFIIDKKGVLKDPKIVKSLCKPCDAEALRVVKLLEGWTPARHNGQVVSYQYVVPFMFKM